MTDKNDRQHRSLLQTIAQRAMVERGLLSDFSPHALAELDRIHQIGTFSLTTLPFDHTPARSLLNLRRAN
jgi:hypothetical protein